MIDFKFFQKDIESLPHFHPDMLFRYHYLIDRVYTDRFENEVHDIDNMNIFDDIFTMIERGELASFNSIRGYIEQRYYTITGIFISITDEKHNQLMYQSTYLT
jgi:hypothetical protein